MAAGVASFAAVVNDSCDSEAVPTHESVGTSSLAGDHEGKPCHVTYPSGARCSCRSCYGNNWGNYYCTRCKHEVKYHY